MCNEFHFYFPWGLVSFLLGTDGVVGETERIPTLFSGNVWSFIVGKCEKLTTIEASAGG